MSLKMQEPSPELPLGKIIAGILVVLLIIGAGISWYVGLENEKKANDLLVLAQDDFRLRKIDAGLKKINKALALKEKPDYLELKLEFLLKKNRVYEADQVLDKIIQYKADKPHYYYISSKLAIEENNLEKAVQRLTEASALEPANANYKIHLGNALIKKGDVEAATDVFEELIEADPNYLFAWKQYITVLSNEYHDEKAVEVANRAIKRFPKDFYFHFLLASSLDKLGRQKQAAQVYRTSLELKPTKNSIAAKRIFEITGRRVPLELEKLSTDRVNFTYGAKDQLMYVDAWVNDKKGRFLLDTGASICVLYNSKLKTFGVTPSPFKAEIETANGIIQAPMSFASARLGKYTVKNVVFVVTPEPEKMKADGIIGMDYLKHFRFEVDRASRTLVLKR